jgi:hypothetical protein
MKAVKAMPTTAAASTRRAYAGATARSSVVTPSVDIATRYAGSVMGAVWWPADQANYIRRRGERYPGAAGIDPGWTTEAATDPSRIVRDPDPKSRAGAIRIVGYSYPAGSSSQ